MATGFNTQVSNGEYRLQFETDNREYYLLMQETARRCVDGKPVTNADRIRSMDDEELAVLLADEIPHGDCHGCDLDCSTSEGDKFKDSCHNAFYKWLQQPAE